MVMSFNQAQVIGHLGQDPEIRTFQNGGKIANLSIATSRRWKDRTTGETKERTEWHRIVIRSEGLVAMVADYARKGSALMVQGELETRKWQDQSGNDRYSTEIVVGGYSGVVRLLDSRERTGQTHNPGRSSSSAPPPSRGGGYDQSPDIDDEIPF